MMDKARGIINQNLFRRVISGVVIFYFALSPIFFLIFFGPSLGLAIESSATVTSYSTSTSNTIVIDNDWYIDSFQNTTISNHTIILNGNIIINSSGILSLINVTLFFNNTKINSYIILVNNNGSFNLFSSSLSAVTKYTGNKIIFRKNSIGNIQNSIIANLGKFGEDFSGLVLESDRVKINNCIIDNNIYGIFLKHSSPSIKKIKISNCKIGIYGIDTTSEIYECNISSCQLGIKLTNDSKLHTIDSIFDLLSLLDNSTILSKNSLIIQVKFSTPIIKSISNADILITNNGDTVYSTQYFGGNQNKTDIEGSILPVIVNSKLYTNKNVTNYDTMLSVKYKTRAVNNRLLNINGAHTETVYFSNQLPSLSNPNVSPSMGDTESNFCYKIRYEDDDFDPPIKVNVKIDGVTHKMSSISCNPDWKNGTWFQYITTLPIGEHNFGFITNDGLVFDDISLPSDETKFLSGPVVVGKNCEPVLSDGLVSPEVGNQDTEFLYSIKYYDPEGDLPNIAKVYIDDLPHTMSQLSTDDSDDSGESESANNEILEFVFVTKLPTGNHSFYFKFNDDNGSEIVQFPDKSSNSIIEGPIVDVKRNHPPIIDNGSVSPPFGHRFIKFSYTISFLDPEGDLPTIAVVVIDGFAFNLTRARITQHIYFYEGYMPLGEHYFHFEFWDLENKHYSRYPANSSQELLGPIVIDYPPILNSGQVTPTIGNKETVFNFSIEYEDPENDLPINASVVIDNNSFALISFSGLSEDVEDEDVENSDNDDNNLGNRLVLSHSTQLTLGKHKFYFIINSGSYILRYPGEGYLIGPEVVEKIENDPLNNSNITIENPINNNTGNGEDSNNDSQTSKDNNQTEQKNSELEEFRVLNYTITESKIWMGTVYIFNVYCQVPDEYINNALCWIYLNGESFMMQGKKMSKGNYICFGLSIRLLPGEYSYHLLFSLGDSMVRYPYKGEFRGPIVEEEVEQPIEDDANVMADRESGKLELNDMQIIAIVVLFLSFAIFSIYYTYFQPKKKHL